MPDSCLDICRFDKQVQLPDPEVIMVHYNYAFDSRTGRRVHHQKARETCDLSRLAGQYSQGGAVEASSFCCTTVRTVLLHGLYYCTDFRTTGRYPRPSSKEVAVNLKGKQARNHDHNSIKTPSNVDRAF